MGLKRAMVIGLDAADPVQVKRLMAEGKMPNLKKLLESGVANENLAMIGCLPSVTPPNWTSIATGPELTVLPATVIRPWVRGWISKM